MSLFAECVKTWLEAGVGFFYPPVCQLCGSGRATAAGGFVCASCQGEARFIQPPFCARCGCPRAGEITNRFECGNCREADLHFRSARAAVVASEKVLTVIRRYKYHRALWFEPFLTELLIRQAAPELARESWDFIVPIPLHAAKEREREFNQAERLALGLSRATSIPMNNGLVRRVLPTRTQTLLDRRERQANVRDAFAMRQGQKLNGERLVLVDDVLTTGATSSACAKALRAGGAGDVCVWTVARGK